MSAHVGEARDLGCYSLSGVQFVFLNGVAWDLLIRLDLLNDAKIPGKVTQTPDVLNHPNLFNWACNCTLWAES